MISRTGVRIRLLAIALSAAAVLTTGAAAAGHVDEDRGDPRSPIPVFLLDKGRFAVFDPPGVSALEFVDVSDRRVAGTYVDEDGIPRGFVRDARGRFSRVAAPGAIQTFVVKINHSGRIVGTTCDTDPCAGLRGYTRTANGRFTTIRHPGSVSTQAWGLDDRGRVVGDYVDPKGRTHGYLWAKGRFRSIDVPRSIATTVTGLNDRGETVGLYLDADGNPHGFYRSSQGRVTTIDAAAAAITAPFDINDRGRIVGYTTNDPVLPNATEVHGFVLRHGPNSPFTRIDVPRAPRTPRFRDRRPRPDRRCLREPECEPGRVARHSGRSDAAR
jgi:hypothetical protein